MCQETLVLQGIPLKLTTLYSLQRHFQPDNEGTPRETDILQIVTQHEA